MDGGVAALAQLRQCPSITELDLSFSKSGVGEPCPRSSPLLLTNQQANLVDSSSGVSQIAPPKLPGEGDELQPLFDSKFDFGLHLENVGKPTGYGFGK